MMSSAIRREVFLLRIAVMFWNGRTAMEAYRERKRACPQANPVAPVQRLGLQAELATFAWVLKHLRPDHRSDLNLAPKGNISVCGWRLSAIRPQFGEIGSLRPLLGITKRPPIGGFF